MKKKGKRFEALVKNYNTNDEYSYQEAIGIVKKNANAKFDESFEVSINLGVDPRKADQLVRGTVTLPHGTGKKIKVLVFCKEPKDKEALDAGADYAGLDEYVEKVKGGWTDVDVVIATTDVMGMVGRLGRILGPRGLMPNPKSGTVTFDVEKAVNDVKAGKIEYRVDKTGNVNSAVGKCSFSEQALAENVIVLFTSIVKAKPASAKGKYIKSIGFSSTMGPGVAINQQSFAIMDEK